MKIMTTLSIIFLTFPFTLLAQNLPLPNDLNILAFGSCNQHFGDQSYWPNISKTRPDLWLWLGDIVYTDKFTSAKREVHFNSQKQNPFYSEFRKNVPILGIWDDHDYGDNDVGAEYPLKDDSRRILWDFLDYGPTHNHYEQKGAYQSYSIGQADKEILLVILDLRYFKEAPYIDGAMLGETQWQWLQATMRKTKARLIIIASSTQFLPMAYGERWANYPSDKKRLLNEIGFAQAKEKKVLLVSGDRHFGEISKISTPQGPLMEITSSGLTHFTPEFVGPGTVRIGEPLIGKNFGTVEINWKSSVPELTLNLHHINGTLFESVTY